MLPQEKQWLLQISEEWRSCGPLKCELRDSEVYIRIMRQSLLAIIYSKMCVKWDMEC